MTAVTDREQLAYVAAQAADSRVNVELDTGDMTLNIGPQHPATHGTLRLVAKLDGEQVVSCEPVPGYMHRGYEKLSEVRTYPQVTALVNRIDWLGSFANEVPFILAAEQLMEVEAPPRAQWIRTILFELSRIANHLAVPRRHGGPARRHHPRSSSPSATASGPSTRSSPPPAVASTPTSTASAGSRTTCPRAGPTRPARSMAARCGASVIEMEDLLMGNEIFEARSPGAWASSPATWPSPTALSGRQPAGQRRVDWDLRRDADSPLAWKRAGLEGLDPSRRRLVRPLLGPPPGGARVHLHDRAAARRPAVGSDHGQGPPASSRCPPARRGCRHREPARSRWATTSCPKATWCRSGSRSARPASTTSRSCRG